MANLIVISGPQAVGKMTVAQSLKEKINYQLMTNHDSIEVSIKIFKSGTTAQKNLNKLIRENVFNLAIENNINMIFTFVTAFDNQKDIEYLNNLKTKFENSGGNFYFVELKASIETRLNRNITPHRLKQKPSKNNIEWSNNELISSSKEHKLNTETKETIFPNHIKINNENLTPEEVTHIILKKFKLQTK